jgi:DNA-binding CsgD family transcriptional regulator
MTTYNRIIPPDDILLADIAAGLRNFEIAAKHNMERKTVDSYVRYHHLRLAEDKRKLVIAAKPAFRKTRKMPPPSTIAKDIAAGLNNKELAEKYGVSKTTVEFHIKANGLQRDVQFGTVPSNEQIVACLRKGMTGAAIAKQYGCSADPVNKRIRDYDLRYGAVAEAPALARRPKPSPSKHINALGISVPRITAIHGPFRGQTA